MAKKKSAKSDAPKKNAKKADTSAPTKKVKKRRVEQYDHPEAERLNNPPVGLVTPDTEPLQPAKKTYQYDPHLDPQLVWAGKTEHTSFEVHTVSLHVHERIDPRTIINAVQAKNGTEPGGLSPRSKQLGLFEVPEEQLPRREAIEFYKHPHGWSNRLVAGDSLLVMNSLLEKEGMAGKVQMIYLDPPYGIRYGSNFQPFVGQRDVKDRKDQDLTAEPEMLRAFRDTWELGIHSYLTYLRDRLLLARELLHESGSVFVQISDENLHLIRSLLDDVFGATNFVCVITFQKAGSTTSDLLSNPCDYLIWYSKDKSKTKFNRLFLEKKAGSISGKKYTNVELANGKRIPTSELSDTEDKSDCRYFRFDALTSQGYRANTSVPFEFEGVLYDTGKSKNWKTTIAGMERLKLANRISPSRNTLNYVRYVDDFPVITITSLWRDIGGIQSRTDPKVYVVQTATQAIKRCLLMTTDPGDLVLDPTCGSGTTAYVAEQWGRRWITCDTSRVAVTLAKQRLLTSSFDYYELAHPSEGVGSGFVYKTVPHVTLKSIANNPEIKEGMSRVEIDASIARYADQETLYDQPKVDKQKVRVTGPFTVEAVPAVNVETIGSEPQALASGDPPLPADASIARSGATARQEDWRSELLQTGVRGKGGAQIEFARLEPLPALRYLHAVGETKVVDSGQGSGGSKKAKTDHQPLATDHSPQRVVVSFGPEHAPLEQRHVDQALDEAEHLRPKPDLVLFAAFHFDPEAAKDIDETTWPGVEVHKVQMNADLLTDDLKKKKSSNESFWLIGQPDIEVEKIERAGSSSTPAEYRVTVHGFDYYNPATGTVDSGGTEKIALWLLDTDYDGRSLYPRQVFFVLSPGTDQLKRLAKTLKAEIDEERIESYFGTQSLPFEAGDFNRVAVKIIDDRGIESLKVVNLE